MRSPKKLLCTDTPTAGLRRTSIILVLTIKTGNWFEWKMRALFGESFFGEKST